MIKVLMIYGVFQQWLKNYSGQQSTLGCRLE
jgi:hypothetical protein